LTKEGYGWQFGVNCVSHALFAQHLLPLLPKTATQPDIDVRIITVASEAAKVLSSEAGTVLDQVKTAFPPSPEWWQPKPANLLLSNNLAQVYPSFTSIANHPSGVNIDNLSKADGAGWFTYLLRLLLMTTGVIAEEGAMTRL